jgi:hypothetical protein
MGRGKHLVTQLSRQLDWCEKLLAQAHRDEAHRKKMQAKARSKRRPKCRCAAYPWPHRPGGGLCRYPDPPAATWKGQAGKNKPQELRMRGLVKRLCRQYGLNPIRDRDRIARMMPKLYAAWCKINWPLWWWYLRCRGRLDERDRLRVGGA